MTHSTQDTEHAAAYRALGGTPKPSEAEVLRERLEVLHSAIHSVDWDGLVRARPDAAEWFDDTGRAL